MYTELGSIFCGRTSNIVPYELETIANLLDMSSWIPNNDQKVQAYINTFINNRYPNNRNVLWMLNALALIKAKDNPQQYITAIEVLNKFNFPDIPDNYGIKASDLKKINAKISVKFATLPAYVSPQGGIFCAENLIEIIQKYYPCNSQPELKVVLNDTNNPFRNYIYITNALNCTTCDPLIPIYFI